MEHKCNVVCAEKVLLHKPTRKVISNAYEKCQRRLKVTDKVISSVETDILRLQMTVTRGFLSWCMLWRS